MVGEVNPVMNWIFNGRRVAIGTISDEFFSAPQTLRSASQTVNIKLFFHRTTWTRHDKNWDVWHLALCSFLNRLFVMHLRLYSSCPSPQYRFPVRFDSTTKYRPNNDQELQTNRRYRSGRFSLDQPKTNQIGDLIRGRLSILPH